MGVLPQASEVIFEVQMKWNNEKVKRRKISFSTYKTHFILFFFFGPLLFSNLIIFLFLIHFKWFKNIIRASLYKSSLNTNGNIHRIFWVFKIDLCSVWWFGFIKFLTFLTLGGITFSFLIHFSQLLACHMQQEGGAGFKLCLDTRNNKALPLDSGCPEHLVFNHQPIYLIWFSGNNKKYKGWLKTCASYVLNMSDLADLLEDDGHFCTSSCW